MNKYKANIIVKDDWHMVNGTFSNPNLWNGLRSSITEIVRTNGRLLGTVDNWFYGNIKVYKISY